MKKRIKLPLDIEEEYLKLMSVSLTEIELNLKQHNPIKINKVFPLSRQDYLKFKIIKNNSTDFHRKGSWDIFYNKIKRIHTRGLK